MADPKAGGSKLEIAGILLVLGLGISIYSGQAGLRRDVQEMEQAVIAHTLINGKLPVDLWFGHLENELREATQDSKQAEWEGKLPEVVYRWDNRLNYSWGG